MWRPQTHATGRCRSEEARPGIDWRLPDAGRPGVGPLAAASLAEIAHPPALRPRGPTPLPACGCCRLLNAGPAKSEHASQTHRWMRAGNGYTVLQISPPGPISPRSNDLNRPFLCPGAACRKVAGVANTCRKMLATMLSTGWGAGLNPEKCSRRHCWIDFWAADAWFDPMWPNVDQNCPESGQVWPSVAEVGPIRADLGQTLANVGLLLAIWGRIWRPAPKCHSAAAHKGHRSACGPKPKHNQANLSAASARGGPQLPRRPPCRNEPEADRVCIGLRAQPRKGEAKPVRRELGEIRQKYARPHKAAAFSQVLSAAASGGQQFGEQCSSCFSPLPPLAAANISSTGVVNFSDLRGSC